jgi:hypothetical protein
MKKFEWAIIAAGHDLTSLRSGQVSDIRRFRMCPARTEYSIAVLGAKGVGIGSLIDRLLGRDDD